MVVSPRLFLFPPPFIHGGTSRSIMNILFLCALRIFQPFRSGFFRFEECRHSIRAFVFDHIQEVSSSHWSPGFRFILTLDSNASASDQRTPLLICRAVRNRMLNQHYLLVEWRNEPCSIQALECPIERDFRLFACTLRRSRGLALRGTCHRVHYTSLLSCSFLL